MTIRFTKSWNGYYEGQIVTNPAGGNTEAQLITLGYAVSDLDGPDNSLQLAKFATDSSNNVTGLVGPGGSEIPLGLRQPGSRKLKKFVDLANATTAAVTVTAVTSIDQNSPFGGPALKVVITPSATGTWSVDLTNLNIAAFDGHVAASVWVDEPHRIAHLQMWQCADTTPTNYTSWQTNFFAGGDHVGGPRAIWGGPMGVGANVANVGTGFVSGTSPLKMVRFKATVYAGAATTLWIRDVYIPKPQRPVVCFTWDDAYKTWMTRVLPILSAANVKATFGIYSAGIDLGAAYVTSADVQTLVASGHQVGCHNVNNYRLQTLSSNGNGEENGTTTANDSIAYTTEYHTARQALENLGVPPEDLMYHPWVQGGSDTQAATLLAGAGVEIARTTTPYEPQPYGYTMGNDVLNLRAWPLGSGKTLAQNKAAVDLAVRYGGLLVFMGHDTQDTAADSITIAESDLRELVQYVAASGADVLTIRQLRDRLNDLSALDTPSTNPSPPVRMIGRLLGANFNATTDQAITLPTGSWVITQVYAVKSSVSMTTAAGGVYTTTAKGGTAIVEAAQVYTALTGTATDLATLTMAATPTVTSSIYLSLTTAQGATATADVFVFGRPA